MTVFVHRPVCVAFLLCAGTGCAAWTPRSPGATVSFGPATAGGLWNGERLERRGEGFVRARPRDSTRYGLGELVSALRRAAAAVSSRFPGTAPVRVGDLSWAGGGKHPRHGSHRTGRDVDIIFYLTDSLGRSVRGRGWLAFDSTGMVRDPKYGGLYRFDVVRNWALVEALLSDRSIEVQWIFCGAALKAKMLEHALREGVSPTLLHRAAWVMHQPRTKNPHVDHFHVRIACPAEQRALGCVDGEPFWPWIRTGSKPDGLGGTAGDAQVLRWLLEDL